MAAPPVPTFPPEDPKLAEPSKETRKKYGLSLEAWQEMARKQNFACAVCVQVPKRFRLCIDHFHVKGWKKMPPEERVKYVRGLTCFRCNTTFLGRGITVDISKRVVSYLEAFEARRPELPKKKIRNHD